MDYGQQLMDWGLGTTLNSYEIGV